MRANFFAPIPWYYRQPERWDLEEDSIRERFPNSKLGERLNPRRHLFLRLNLHPLHVGSPIGQIASHLAANKPLHVTYKIGALVPSENSLESLDIPSESSLYEPYKVEVIYNEPPQVPDIYIVSPRVDEETFPNHPHLRYGCPHPLGFIQSAACVIAPHDGKWLWETSTVVQLIEWTAIWLACHVLWVQTGTWFGPQAPHDTKTLYQTIKPTSPCHCGSGKHYLDCHRHRDKKLLTQRR